jgi:hypothetical protein
MLPTILVCADEHLEIDEWVTEQANTKAVALGWTVGEYRGLENMQGRPGLTCVMYHVFTGVLPS